MFHRLFILSIAPLAVFIFLFDAISAVNTGGPYLGAQTQEEHEGDYLVGQMDSLPQEQRQQLQELLQIINNLQSMQDLKQLASQLSAEKLAHLQELQTQIHQINQLQQLSPSGVLPLDQLAKLVPQKLQEQQVEVDRQFNFLTPRLTEEQERLIKSPEFLQLSDKNRLRELFKLLGVTIK